MNNLEICKKNWINKYFSFWSETEKPSKLDIFLVVIVLGFCSITFMYGDIYATIEHSMNFLDSVFQGEFMNFYQIAIENSTYGHPAVYDFPIYLVFGIWNFPIYLLNKLTGINYLYSLPCLVWAKMMLVFFALLSAKVLFMISRELGINNDRCKWVVFFFLTATTLVVSTFLISQYDIISILFVLLGIYSFIKKETKKFILWFVLANTMKLFSVFIFIPLVLLKEKKIFKATIQILLGLLGIIICKLLFRGNAAYIASTKSFSGDMLARLEGTSINWQYDNYLIPFFVVVFVGICIFSYIRHCDSKYEIGKVAVYISLVVFYAFLAFVPFNPYWMVLVTPYSVLAIFLNPKYLKINILLDSVIGFILVWLSTLINYWVFSVGMMNNMLLSHIFMPNYQIRFYNLRELIQSLDLEKFSNFLVAILIACIIAFIILNYPKRENIFQTNNEKIERSMVWLRAFVPCVFISLHLFCYIFPQESILYNSISDHEVSSSVNLLTQGASVEEIFEFDTNVEINKFEIQFGEEIFPWIDSSLIRLEVYEKNNDRLIYIVETPANMMKNSIAVFKTKHLELEKDKMYTIKLSAFNGEDIPLYLQLDNKNDFETYENGELIQNDLSMRIYGKSI
ncbi:EpsG family protein [Eubacterium callanderi]|uniref:DUF2029 domain-containing protein n=1 Tax=Eubacterium callanderi TaxID=53442 RepID=E3GGJ5_9FIRM|nr:EpsG family protein [Eubacterium callanderi]ADO38800.1 hypothetical protein ELI_3853 [Eubacterium callanderi]MCB6661592.1 EpsG family protein [Eubacterium callanderi]MCB6754463.1 EpsG family protein [Eubacterium callanderi]MCB7106166.1 EpsG family protein [Eubacterium callanderi]MCG4821519.1 EpsG family protein [Eubacterium callanderi]